MAGIGVGVETGAGVTGRAATGAGAAGATGRAAGMTGGTAGRNVSSGVGGIDVAAVGGAVSTGFAEKRGRMSSPGV
jgi:hypothetical protein